MGPVTQDRECKGGSRVICACCAKSALLALDGWIAPDQSGDAGIRVQMGDTTAPEDRIALERLGGAKVAVFQRFAARRIQSSWQGHCARKRCHTLAKWQRHVRRMGEYANGKVSKIQSG